MRNDKSSTGELLPWSTWGNALLERDITSKGHRVLHITTPKGELQVRITPSGKFRVRLINALMFGIEHETEEIGLEAWLRCITK